MHLRADAERAPPPETDSTSIEEQQLPTVLFAVTASPVWTMKDGSTIPAGFWAEEIVDPYNILISAGITVMIATPGGAAAPLQAYSIDESMTGSAQRTTELQRSLAALDDRLAHPLALADIDIAGIDAMYIPGGTGPMEDLHSNDDLGRLLNALQTRSALIAAACHGTIALLSARDDKGDWVFKGYEMTGYTNEEESLGGPGDAAPFTLETKLRGEGARYISSAPWTPLVVTDRNLITGQNPSSAAEVARQLAAALARSTVEVTA
jgi:putative intracellular protease/amidase